MNRVSNLFRRKPVSVPKLGRWSGVIDNQNSEKLIDWANMDNGFGDGVLKPSYVNEYIKPGTIKDLSNKPKLLKQKENKSQKVLTPDKSKKKYSTTKNFNATKNFSTTQKYNLTEKYGHIKVNDQYTFDDMLPYVM
jgi:hypothetical protein